MNNDNLRKVRQTLLDEGYTPPEFEQFEKDMQDEKNLLSLHNTLKKEGYTPPEFEQFKKDMGFGSTEASPKSAGLLSRMVSPFFDKANSMMESAPKPKPSNKAEDYQFTEAQLKSGRSAEVQPQQVTQEEPQQPIDLSRPEEYQIPKPFKKGGEEARELAQNFNNSLWARTQAETNSDLLNPTKDNFAERMASMEMAQQVEAARRMNRGELMRLMLDALSACIRSLCHQLWKRRKPKVLRGHEGKPTSLCQVLLVVTSVGLLPTRSTPTRRR